MFWRIVLCSSLVCALPVCPGLSWAQAQTVVPEQVKQMQEQIHELGKQMEAQRMFYEGRMQQLQEKLDALSRTLEKRALPERELEDAIAERTVAEPASESGGLSSVGRAIQSMNPQISVVVDTFYYEDDVEHGIDDAVFGKMAGFSVIGSGDQEHDDEDHEGHSHGSEGHDHGLDEGFNLREVELYLGAEVDPYFSAYTTVGISDDGAELEEAVVRTTFLPYGFQLLGGNFLSHFGRINQQHPHQWDFTDQPLIYRLTLGDHGLLEKGMQVSWLAPTTFHLLAGVEILQGENGHTFSQVEGNHLPDREGPRLGVGWLKFSPNLPRKHGLQAGLFGAFGYHQESHDGNADGEEDHWLDGNSYFAGADIVYKYDSDRAHGFGDFLVQGEYFYRVKDLDVEDHELDTDLIGGTREDTQDGFYLQALYGFWPRYRAGLRWDMVGLTNEVELPDGDTLDYGASWRLTSMIDFSPTEFSRLRLQGAYGDYQLTDSMQDVWQIFVQLLVTFGTHGAHKF